MVVHTQVNCTRRCENGECVQFSFLHECFGVIVLFEKPKTQNKVNLQSCLTFGVLFIFGVHPKIHLA
mgnify:FL=1